MIEIRERLKKKKTEEEEDENSDPDDISERIGEKRLIKNIDCKVRYSFSVKKDSSVVLTTAQ